jgi:hypothetical protein
MKLPDERNDKTASRIVLLIANLITRVSLVVPDIPNIGRSIADDRCQWVVGCTVA